MWGREARLLRSGMTTVRVNGNFFTNWLNDRGDLLQDAQIDLNKSIGRLTQKSSQLLIVNTALSKLLNQQQQILLNQQHILEGQTCSLAEQNEQILKQQVLLEEQQKEINKANLCSTFRCFNAGARMNKQRSNSAEGCCAVAWVSFSNRKTYYDCVPGKNSL